jgi:peptide-methionine (R)-S-oxide reductase
MRRFQKLLAIFAILFPFICPMNLSAESSVSHLEGVDLSVFDWRSRPDSWWRSKLTPEQFRVCRKGGTEAPFSGKYCHLKELGDYTCSSCGLLLFRSDSKFDSGTGWPSFSRAVKEGVLVYHEDRSHGMVRTEVRCSRCDAHLGHVFEDGPPPTRKRFCINSVCIRHNHHPGTTDSR